MAESIYREIFEHTNPRGLVKLFNDNPELLSHIDKIPYDMSVLLSYIEDKECTPLILKLISKINKDYHYSIEEYLIKCCIFAININDPELLIFIINELPLTENIFEITELLFEIGNFCNYDGINEIIKREKKLLQDKDENFVMFQHLLNGAAFSGNVKVVKHILNKYSNRSRLMNTFNILDGKAEMIQLISNCIIYSVKGGNLDCVKFLTKFPRLEINILKLLETAESYGFAEIANHLRPEPKGLSLNSVVFAGNMNVILTMKKKGTDRNQLNRLLINISNNKNVTPKDRLEVAQYATDRGALISPSAIFLAAKNNFEDLLLFLLDIAIKNGNKDAFLALEGCAKTGNVNLMADVDFKLRGDEELNYDKNINRVKNLFISAVESGNVEMVKFVEILQGDVKVFNSKEIMMAAGRSGSESMIDLIWRKTKEDLSLAMDEAINGEHVECIIYLIHKGVNLPDRIKIFPTASKMELLIPYFKFLELQRDEKFKIC